ncbi:sulfatase-like hydrolase/transferase [Proteus terrae]|uniref:sulfatase-like hydrolase/transferase n=1 Tax=Proteus terrae TaxID=1574161 RepID=UPI001F260A67|nr:sulfatase-like hydrolase/transferase [Proteus terrae]MCE9838825.1 sulfatase-like hydrolase/transferase [Proteus terrae]
MIAVLLLITMCIVFTLSYRFFLIKSLIIIVSMMLVMVWYIANDFTGNGMDDAFLYTVTNSIEGTPIIENIKYFIYFLISLSLIILLIIFTKKRKFKNYFFDMTFILACILFLTISEPIKNILNLISENNNFSKSEDDYITNKNILKSVNGNYVFIIAESLERSFKDINGVNYLNNISNIDNQVDFSNIGYIRGSGWTIAGHINFICGLPFIGTGNAANKIKTFLPKAKCFSDITNNAGYKNIYLSGTNTFFAGTKNFLESHSFSEIIDINTLNDKYNSDEKKNSWGLDDQVILDEAFDIFTKESQSKTPFMLYVSTINTHSPGHSSYSCEKFSEDRYLDSIMCADKIISEFIKKIKNSEYYDNTTIVLISDHGLMHWKSLIGVETKRTNLLTVFNKSLKNEVIDNKGTVIDQLPSALEAISKNKVSFGFGRGVYKSENSLGILSDEHNMFAKSLWAYPKVNQRIYYNGGDKINIGSVKFSMPICIYYDNNYDILEYGYSDGVKEKCINDIDKKTDNNIIMAKQCNDDLCIDIYKDKNIERKIININSDLFLFNK